MADNGVYLRCTLCGQDSERFYLAKYFSTVGWYTHTRKRDDEVPHSQRLITEEEFTQEFNKWLSEHVHYTSNGEHLRLEYERDSKGEDS